VPALDEIDLSEYPAAIWDAQVTSAGGVVAQWPAHLKIATVDDPHCHYDSQASSVYYRDPAESPSASAVPQGMFRG